MAARKSKAKKAQDAAAERLIAFQGEPGAYSHAACLDAFPDMVPMPCPTFEDAFAAVERGHARHAMIPIDNSVAGRVADNHHLLPESKLHIVAEHFRAVNHQLLGPNGATLKTVKIVRSHVHALGQCRKFLRKHRYKAEVHADTAGAAREVAELGDPSIAAIASSLAADTYGLEILARDIEDAEHNTTRFVVLARDAVVPKPGDGPTMMTFVFQVRNVPAALYKALGGFATNGINMTKLESYQLGGSFNATQFYADIVGHPSERSVKLAFEELGFFTTKVKILGVYPAKRFGG
jgi:prephenate dehydratase